METLISNNLKRIREERNLNKAQVAKKLNTTRSNITRWEQNITPGLKHLIKLAELYSVSLDELINYDGKHKRGGKNSRKERDVYHVVYMNIGKKGEVNYEERYANISDIKNFIGEQETTIIIKCPFGKKAGRVSKAARSNFSG